ncbi:MAG: DUF6595 domain-containing protein [Myxococcota bacterium]
MARIVLAALVVGLMPSSAGAHSLLIEPPSRSEEDFLMDGPCGGVPKGEPTTYEAGSLIDMQWDLTQNHFNVFRVAFSPAGDEGFDDNVIGTRPDVEGVFSYTQPVPLPLCTCTDCTLQLTQFTATGNLAYYSCADIELVAPDGMDVPECLPATASTTGEDAGDSSGGDESTGPAPAGTTTTAGSESTGASSPEQAGGDGCRVGGSGGLLWLAPLAVAVRRRGHRRRATVPSRT